MTLLHRQTFTWCTLHTHRTRFLGNIAMLLEKRTLIWQLVQQLCTQRNIYWETTRIYPTQYVSILGLHKSTTVQHWAPHSKSLTILQIGSPNTNAFWLHKKTQIWGENDSSRGAYANNTEWIHFHRWNCLTRIRHSHKHHLPPCQYDTNTINTLSSSSRSLNHFSMGWLEKISTRTLTTRDEKLKEKLH